MMKVVSGSFCVRKMIDSEDGRILWVVPIYKREVEKRSHSIYILSARNFKKKGSTKRVIKWSI